MFFHAAMGEKLNKSRMECILMFKTLKKSKGRVLSAVMSAVVTAGLLAASFPVSTSAATTVSVDTKKQYQTVRGFGGINLPEWISQGDMTDAQVQKAFGNGNDELGLTILRIYVSDDSNAWSRAVPTAKRAQKLGATIFATPWNPPASIRQNGDGKITGGKYQLRSDKWAEYAQHLNSYVKYMEGQGIKLYSISVQNEPDYAQDWTYWSASDLAKFIAQYGQAVKQGTKAKLMSPESFQYRKDIYTPILNNPQAMANVDLFGTHFYGTQRNQMDYPAIENCGKELWMTEVYVPDSSSDADKWPQAVDVAENIHNGLVVGNLNAYVWWYIRRSYGLLKENGNISKRGYCMAQYSKFVRPGDIRIDATEQPANGVYVSAYKSTDKVTIVAVNKGSDVSQEFSLKNGEKIKNIDRYRTTGSENLALTKNLEFTGSSFWAQLPSNSVSTFVISLGDGSVTVDPQPTAEPTTKPAPVADANGYFFNNNFEGDTAEWKARGESSVMTSGRTSTSGSEALLIQDRTSAWHGAGMTLDPDTFEPGKSYSFSVNAAFLDSDDDTDTLCLKLQYEDSANEPHYVSIAEKTASKGQWVQLANSSFKIPEDATNMLLYVETAESTNNFYIDDAIGAKDGVVINASLPAPPATEPPTQAPTEAPTEPPTTVAPTEAPTTAVPTTAAPTEAPTTAVPATEAPTEAPTLAVTLYGDATCDGYVNLADALLILQNVANATKYPLTPQGTVNADCHTPGDGISALDALSIQRLDAKAITSLPDMD